MKYLRITAVLAALLIGGAMCGTSMSTNKNSSNTVVNRNVTNTTSRTSGSFSTGSTNTAAATEVTLTASGIDQPLVAISAGARVEFRNSDTIAHQLTTDDTNSTIATGFGQRLEPNSTYAYLFANAGTVRYHDALHPDDTNFQGTVTVR